MTEKKCSVCDAKFICGEKSNQIGCWCAQFPMIMPVKYDQDCRCKNCLTIAIAQKIEAAIVGSNHEEILKIASQYSSQKSLIENIDYAIEGGNYVFSTWYHLRRGSCCGNGCRHCPYSDGGV